MGCASSKPAPGRSGGKGKGAAKSKGKADNNMDVLLSPVPVARPRAAHRALMAPPGPAVRPRGANRSSMADPARRRSRMQEHLPGTISEA
ncbi:hypothetical protein PpBr36_00072 [Pyricularia pennisetigena]|uniref:hypothetical protein n=1 Tax=Pyricularia pennisetigena TaxID=1578925 RepID=UPI0011520E29|nr:hypothetical protein PpBr36_00072 [Pyricularia pennisetigena]TLS28084.1 hypothetical protein PpBr36_00072 [Pyricularia pennisetigena]